MPDQNALPTPGLACLTGGHIIVTVRDGHAGDIAASWCLWCGAGMHDGDRLDDDGMLIPSGWTNGPVLVMEDSQFTRDHEDMPR